MLETTIGSDAGEEPYLFGRVASITSTKDRIYVLDTSVNRVRGYALSGEHLGDIGRLGGGPGEFFGPRAIDVDGLGNVYVQARGEIEVYDPDGRSIATWRVDAPAVTALGPVSLAVSQEGVAYVAEIVERNYERPWEVTYGLNTFDEGLRGTPRQLPVSSIASATLILETSAPTRTWASAEVPFMPRTVMAVSRAGTLVIGNSRTYSFECHRRDGTVLQVSKYWDPLPVTTQEEQWNLAELRTFISRADRVSGWGPEVGLPSHKPAFKRIVVDRAERIWVFRASHGLPIECNAQSGELPCWRDSYTVDVFDPEGRFLGEVQLPDEFLNRRRGEPFSPRPEIRGNAFVALVEDEAGVQYVKRYRLEAPGVGTDDSSRDTEG